MTRAAEVADKTESDALVRKAFALLLKGDTSRLQKWLDAVAKDDPAQAFELVIKMAELVIPRMAPIEVIVGTRTSADVHKKAPHAGRPRPVRGLK